MVDTVNVTDRSGRRRGGLPAGDGRFTFIQPAGKSPLRGLSTGAADSPLRRCGAGRLVLRGVAGLCQHGLIEADPAVSFSPSE